MCTSKRRSPAIRSLLALVVSALLLSSCATNGAAGDEEESGDLFKKDDPQLAENHSYIVDAPHSAALEPSNWLDYSAYYLGEIVLAPFRLIQMVIDGA